MRKLDDKVAQIIRMRFRVDLWSVTKLESKRGKKEVRFSFVADSRREEKKSWLYCYEVAPCVERSGRAAREST